MTMTIYAIAVCISSYPISHIHCHHEHQWCYAFGSGAILFVLCGIMDTYTNVV